MRPIDLMVKVLVVFSSTAKVVDEVEMGKVFVVKQVYENFGVRKEQNVDVGVTVSTVGQSVVGDA